VPAHDKEKVMHLLLREEKDDGEAWGYSFWCPGCASVDPVHGLHVFITKDEDPDFTWQYDGESSFEPSLSYETHPNVICI
jgi:hypothetical protein